MMRILAIFILSFLTVFAKEDALKPKQKLNLKAQSVNFLNEDEGRRKLEAKGDVEVDYATYKLCSNSILIDERKDTLEATENVVLTDKANKATFKTQKITSNKSLTNASISEFYFEKDKIYGNGEEGRKNEDIISLKEVYLSTCGSGKKGKAPEWKVKSKNGSYNIAEDEIKLYNTIFYFKNIPVLWLPFFTFKPSRTHGFLGPSIDFNGDQVGLTTPYFVSFKEKQHYFVFSPQFMSGKYNPKNKSKVNNYRLNYKYSLSQNQAFFDFRFAPNAYFQKEPNGEAMDKRDDRYSLTSGLDFAYKYGNYGFSYNKISDRFFRRSYLDEKGENYLTNKIFFTYFAPDNSQNLELESASFVPIAFAKKNNLPKLDFYANYGKRLYKKSHLSLDNTINLTKFSRDVGVNHSRVSNLLTASYFTKLGRLETTINPELRLDFYKKNYTADLGILTSNQDETVVRFIPSLFVKNQMPIYFKFKDNEDYLISLTPQVNVSITQENLNNKNILNEDSGTVFLNSQNLMSKKSVYGYDLIDEGLVLTYGSKASILHKSSKSNLGLFLGQRMKKTFTGEKGLDFSGYFGSVEASLIQTFKFNTDFIISEANEITYAKSTAQISFGILKTSFTNTFIDKSLLNNAKLNVNENQYTFTVKFNDEWSINSTLIENRNFKEKNGEIKRKNVSSIFSLTLAKDCLTFVIGAKRERYTAEDYESKYKIYTSIMLLGI